MEITDAVNEPPVGIHTRQPRASPLGVDVNAADYQLNSLCSRLKFTSGGKFYLLGNIFASNLSEAFLKAKGKKFKTL